MGFTPCQEQKIIVKGTKSSNTNNYVEYLPVALGSFFHSKIETFLIIYATALEAAEEQYNR
jgi:hypothetical protein